jgi:hypothetical protein
MELSFALCDVTFGSNLYGVCCHVCNKVMRAAMPRFRVCYALGDVRFEPKLCECEVVI